MPHSRFITSFLETLNTRLLYGCIPERNSCQAANSPQKRRVLTSVQLINKIIWPLATRTSGRWRIRSASACRPNPTAQSSTETSPNFSLKPEEHGGKWWSCHIVIVDDCGEFAKHFRHTFSFVRFFELENLGLRKNSKLVRLVDMLQSRFSQATYIHIRHINFDQNNATRRSWFHRNSSNQSKVSCNSSTFAS